MIEGIKDKIVIIVSIERRLEVDGCDVMQKPLAQGIILVVEDEKAIDKIRELLKQAEQNPFTFL